MKKYVILKNGQFLEIVIARRDADVISKLTKRFEPWRQPKQWRMAGRNKIQVFENSHSDTYEVKLESEWLASKIPPN